MNSIKALQPCKQTHANAKSSSDVTLGQTPKTPSKIDSSWKKRIDQEIRGCPEQQPLPSHMVVFCSVSLKEIGIDRIIHSRVVSDFEVKECYLMECDFLLKLIVKDRLPSILLGKLAALPNISQIQSSFVPHEIGQQPVPIYLKRFSLEPRLPQVSGCGRYLRSTPCNSSFKSGLFFLRRTYASLRCNNSTPRPTPVGKLLPELGIEN
jgi:hypothetical protein